MESFFSVGKVGITQLNASGIASMLTFAGYGIVPPEQYALFKKELIQHYDKRSKALHRAEFQHIEPSDLQEFSVWSSWVIISITALADRGYSSLRQLHQQTSRLDTLSDPKPTLDYSI